MLLEHEGYCGLGMDAVIFKHECYHGLGMGAFAATHMLKCPGHPGTW